MFEAPAIDWNVILPFVIVAGWGILLMVVDLFVSEDLSLIHISEPTRPY